MKSPAWLGFEARTFQTKDLDNTSLLWVSIYSAAVFHMGILNNHKAEQVIETKI